MDNSSEVEKKAVGLALSGGGVRAASFHAGVLRYLAEQGLLENVVHVSSVSGGTLFIGMVFRLAEYQWPGSRTYLDDVFSRFRHILTTLSLQNSFWAQFSNPSNWRDVLGRVHVLAQGIEALWDIKALFSKLGNFPAWSVNCTTAETGRRFRFKNIKYDMGDYELGYADAGNFSLAKVMAVSSAFPGAVGPLTIKAKDFEWKKREKWKEGEYKTHRLRFKYVHLYDGGVYDNLGIEPMFDVGTQELKKDDDLRQNVNYLIVSNGGSLLTRQDISRSLNPSRFWRLFDIILDQNQSIRRRSFTNFLYHAPTSGAYVRIGIPPKLSGENWLSPGEVDTAAKYGTNLSRMSEKMFDLIARHGYETTKWNMEK